MQSPPLSIGDPIEARCTKCRKNTTHAVVELVEEAASKVECSECKRQHKYRPPTVPRKASVRRTVDPADAERKEWQSLRADIENAQTADYSMTSAFKVNTVVKHPQFGLGLVQGVLGPQKIEVLFEDGKKKMRCK